MQHQKKSKYSSFLDVTMLCWSQQKHHKSWPYRVAPHMLAAAMAPTYLGLLEISCTMLSSLGSVQCDVQSVVDNNVDCTTPDQAENLSLDNGGSRVSTLHSVYL